MAFKYVERKGPKAKKRPGKSYVAKGKKPPLGKGTRFKALETALAKKKGVKTPERLAAWIGARKYGRKKMTKMAVAAKKRAS